MPSKTSALAALAPFDAYRTFNGARLAIRVCVEHAAANLVELDRFEEGAEITLAETVVALTLDDLEEDRPDHRRGEYLQQQASAFDRRAVYQDAMAAQALDVLAVPGQA